MKNLRQLARHSRLLFNGKRRRRSENRSSEKQRRVLGAETLEKRELLAGDVLSPQLSPQHNYWNSYDVNDDGQITARDALAIINRLGTVSSEGEIGSAVNGEAEMFYDVNADFKVTALDALSVVNAMSVGEEVGELIELQLRALSDPNDINSEISEIAVGDVFHLEVSYEDLRQNTFTTTNKLGAFQLFTDIAVSQPDILVPVLNETQRLVINESIGTIAWDDLTFSLENSATTYVASFADFLNNAKSEIKNALAAFGYTDAQYDVTQVQFDNSDLGFQISYLGSQFGNVNLPNITIEINETNAGENVITRTDEFAPFLADGTTPNPAAVRFNLNTFSRTFNNNEQFYTLSNRGSFDPTNGFTGIGGLGDVPTGGGGIPDLTDDGGFPQPFDAYSIPVMLKSAVTNLQISVNPGEDNEATLLYGRDDAVAQDLVLLDEDAVVTLSTLAVGGFAVAAGTLTTGEDASGTLDLTTLITSGPADGFAIVTNGTLGVATVDGSGVLTYAPNADAEGTDTFTFSATKGSETLTETITVTINGENDAPVAVANSLSTPQDTALTIAAATLLANDTDVDNTAAELSITSVATTTTGATVVLTGTTITYTPVAGFTGNDTFTYTISDGALTSTATVTVDVGAVVTIPVVTDGTLTAVEDTAATIDLSTLLTSGTNVTYTFVDGDFGVASIAGNILTYTPDANEFGSDSVDFTATNSAGSASGTIDITITPVNDAPTAGDATATTTVGQTLTITTDSLLNNADVGADNEDDDELTVTAVSATTASGSTVTLSADGSTLTYVPGPSAGSDSFTYTVDDGSGAANATTTATVNVTVTAGLAAPVAGDGSINTQQNTPGTIDLASLLAGGAFDTLTVTTNGSTGNAAIAGTTLTYTPNANATGNDTVIYTATNATGSDTGTISISVGVVNNDVIPGDVAVSAMEDMAATFTAATLIANSSPGTGEANQTLAISNPRGTSNGGTVTLSSAGGVNYTPAANFFGTETFTLTITDNGSPADSADLVVTVNVASHNDAPVAVNDTTTVNTGSTVNINVLSNDSAGPANEDQALTVTAASSNSGSVTINNDGSLSFTPTAGLLGNAAINYTIQDSSGDQASAMVNVTVEDVALSTLSGAIFIDNIDNLNEVLGGGAAHRNGVQDANDAGISGIQVRLLSSSGATVATVRTRLDGGYTFEGVAPGDYTVVYDVPDSVRTLGSTSAALVVDPNSSTTPVGPSLTLAGTQGVAVETLNILSSSYLRSNRTMSSETNGGREGGLVTFDESGAQEIFIAGAGFDGVTFGEMILSNDGDTALLVVVREGATAPEVASIGSDHFVVSANGRGVQFFGAMDDFDFVSTDTDLLSLEFAGYQAAVDRALSEL